MSQPQSNRTHIRRGNRKGPAPDNLPTCPDCGRELDLSQPDERQPQQVLGVCACGLWSIFARIPDGWRLARRIPAGERLPRPWRRPRPAADQETAIPPGARA